MSARDLADNARRLLRARSFLYRRQAPLYGARPVRFDLEKGYRDFDGMLKRTVYYVRFAVREVVAEARADFAADSMIINVDRQAGLTPAKGGAPGFEDFLRSKRLIAAPGAPLKRIDIDGRIHEVEITAKSPDQVEVRLLPQPAPKQPRLRASLRTLREAWIKELLSAWIGTGSPLQLDGGPEPLFRARSLAWTVSRRISQVDIDISGEEVPHVFRWKETTLARSSAYADLDDADIAAAMAASGVVLPQNAYLQGRLQEDLGQGSSCLLLRYAHMIPDPDPGADGNGATVPPRLNAGFIVMENDYQEILIDAATGKVFSEARKWRPEPFVPIEDTVGELAGASAG